MDKWSVVRRERFCPVDSGPVDTYEIRVENATYVVTMVSRKQYVKDVKTGEEMPRNATTTISKKLPNGQLEEALRTTTLFNPQTHRLEFTDNNPAIPISLIEEALSDDARRRGEEGGHQLAGLEPEDTWGSTN